MTSPTERRNPRSTRLDEVSTAELLQLINTEDHLVPYAVAAVLPAIERAVDLAVSALAAGRRVHYVGAGTSGRLAVLDAAELIPTFGLTPDRVVAHIAGGAGALTRPVENAEDDADAGAAAVAEAGPGDLVVGVAASGRTPYVGGALAYARTQKAFTVLISANPGAPLAELADVHIAPDTGPEVLTGSTRLKAGTAQKLVLNAFSTATMVRLGRVYSNLMTGMLATNAKLRARQRSIVAEAAGTTPAAAGNALAAAAGDADVAVLTLLTGVSPAAARDALAAAGGHLRNALRTFDREA